MKIRKVLISQPRPEDIKSSPYTPIAEAHGLTGLRVTQRAEVEEAVRTARESEGTVLIDFRVKKEDSVYPMVPAGADLHNMIRRPVRTAIVETGQDEL